MAAPTHNMVLTSKSDGGKKPTYTEVGVAWPMPSGNGFSIQLNPGVVLDWRLGETHFINLFQRADSKPAGSGWGTSPGQPPTDGGPIPF